VNICVEQHEPSDPPDARRVMAVSGGCIGTFVGGNPLADGWAPPALLPGPLAVLWSGSLGADPLAPHPANWMPAGRAALEHLCETLPEALPWSGRACFRPHCRHVLSDLPSCRQFLLDHAEGSLGIALAPATLLEPGMLADVEDHLVRWFETLGPVCDAVFLEDAVADEATGSCRTVPLGTGCLPAATVRALLAEHVAEDVPIVLGAEDLEAQIAWLGA
jgi:hypothetical protein